MYLTLILFYYLSSILSFKSFSILNLIVQYFVAFNSTFLNHTFTTLHLSACQIFNTPYFLYFIIFLFFSLFIFYFYFYSCSYFYLIFLFYIFLLLLFCVSGGLARFYSATIMAPIEMIKTIKTGKGRYIQ